MKSNLYESVYKNLEKDVLDLLENIYLCDDHLKVYSMKIAELILRCGSEIEAICKEIYCDNVTEGNREELRFDFDCLKWLFTNWKLDEKIVEIALYSPNLSKGNHYLKPLRGAERPRKNSKSDNADCAMWKVAYMAARHNRSVEFSKCNLESLINALAALYLLNIYYRNESIDTDSAQFDTTQGSSIFRVNICDYKRPNTSDCFIIFDDPYYAEKIEAYANNMPDDLKEAIAYSDEHPKPKRFHISLNKT